MHLTHAKCPLQHDPKPLKQKTMRTITATRAIKSTDSLRNPNSEAASAVLWNKNPSWVLLSWSGEQLPCLICAPWFGWRWLYWVKFAWYMWENMVLYYWLVNACPSLVSVWPVQFLLWTELRGITFCQVVPMSLRGWGSQCAGFCTNAIHDFQSLAPNVSQGAFLHKGASTRNATLP